MYFVYLDDLLIHSPYPRANKLSSGVLTRTSFMHKFEFEVNRTNPAWNNVNPFLSRLRIIKADRNREQHVVGTDGIIMGDKIFEGRIIVPRHSMDKNGQLRAQYTALDRFSYLDDSIQTAYYHEGNNIRNFLLRVLTEHNNTFTADSYKRFKLGNVTVTDPNDKMKKSINDGDNTLEVIKSQLLDPLGGFMVMRDETDGVYIDYLAEVGRVSNQRIMLARNLQSMTREIDPSEAYSIFEPLGEQLELPPDATEQSVGEMGTKRVNISSVNNGSRYIVDEDMMEVVGERKQSIVFEDVESPSVLLQKGLKHKAEQIAAVVHYRLTPLDLSFIDGETTELGVPFDEIELFNWHEVFNELFNFIDFLQIVEQQIDILNWKKSNVVIGSKMKKLSDYRLMMQKERARYTEDLAYQARIQRLANRRLKETQDELSLTQDELSLTQDELRQTQDDLKTQANELGSVQAGMLQVQGSLVSVTDALNQQAGTLTTQVGNLNIFRQNTDSRLTRIFNALTNANIPY